MSTANYEVGGLQVKTFEAEVHRVFQTTGHSLKDVARYRAIPGNKTQFPILGTLKASKRVVGTPVIQDNQSAANVEIETERYSVASSTDIFLENEVNFDAKSEVQAAIVAAANRKMDQVVIDALEKKRVASPTYTNVVGVAVGGNNTSLNVAKIAEIVRLWDVLSVPESDRKLIMHANAYHKFTQETTVASGDYNTSKPLVSGQIPGYYGLDFKKIGTINNENGLTLASNIRYNYAVQKQSLGFVVNLEPKITVSYENTLGAHLITCFFSCGCGVIDELGIVSVQTYE